MSALSCQRCNNYVHNNPLLFNAPGFGAAVANNVIDCVQNVFSKKLLQKLTPVELQFYTSVAAAIIQLPMILYSILPKLLVHNPIGWRLGVMLLIDGLSYHFQSVTAYVSLAVDFFILQHLSEHAVSL